MPRLRGPGPHRAPRRLAAAIVVLLGAGALGAAAVKTGDGDRPATAGDGADTSEPAAGRLVFQRDDFPGGWERSERDDGGPAPATGAAPAATTVGGSATARFCPALGGDPTAGRLTSEAESFFTNASPGTFSFAGSFVGVIDDAAIAPAAFQFLAGEAFLRCAADGFAKGFLEGGAAGVTLTEEASEPIPVVPGAGQAQGRRLTYTARGPAFELPLYVDLAVVHAGTSVGLAYLGAYREPLPADLEQRLLDSLLGRMASTG